MNARAASSVASFLLVAMIFLGVAWELWLAPLRPGGSWIVLKVVPLLFPLMGILKGKRYTYQWTSLLVWPYACEGVMRLMSDSQPASTLAGLQAFLAIALFGAIVAYLRASRIA